MWVPIMAGFSLAVLLGSIAMGAFGNTQQRQTGLQIQAEFMGAAVGGGSSRSSRGVPPRPPARQSPRR